MRVNVDKVLERDQKLSELDDRAGQLHMSCHYYCLPFGWTVVSYLVGLLRPLIFCNQLTVPKKTGQTVNR